MEVSALPKDLDTWRLNADVNESRTFNITLVKVEQVTVGKIRLNLVNLTPIRPRGVSMFVNVSFTTILY